MGNYSKQYNYLGIDETSLGIGRDSVIVVAASTFNKALTEYAGYRALKKSKDILVEAKAYNRAQKSFKYNQMPAFLSFEEMKQNGLDNFYWTRAKGGRFPRQLIEHLSIAHVVHTNGFDPDKTVLFIDAFHGNADESKYIISESLKWDGFNIPREQINIIPDGDRSIQLINYADLLAFQIGLSMNEKYREYHPGRIKMEVEPHEIPYDTRRTFYPLATEARDYLEDIIKSWS
ncbi:MAG: hypothetical protein ACOCQG_05990 [Candidatus Nanoarchaeia archaeon]